MMRSKQGFAPNPYANEKVPDEHVSITATEGHRRLMELCQRGAFSEALPLAKALVAALPDQALFWFLLGCIRSELDDLPHAAIAFQKAAKINPQDSSTLFNLGSVLQRLGDHTAAVTAFEQAIDCDPNHAAAHTNLANALRTQSRLPEAISALRKAVACDPVDLDAATNLADALRQAGDLEEALCQIKAVLEQRPDNAIAQVLLLQLKGGTCDFSRASDFEPLRKTLGITGAAVPPFVMLHLEDDPHNQRRRSEAFARKSFPNVNTPQFERNNSAKLRVGYFSGNFHDHPTMYLTADLFRHHDTSRFEVMGYSLGTRKPSVIRDKIVPHFTAFHECAAQTDHDIAALARQHRLDIAVDLDGYTKGARLGVLAHRAAPIQVSYLAYPSTLAATFIDYFVGDETVIPSEEREHFAEQILFLPDTYAPMDNGRQSALTKTSRADHNLPADAVILCCFNNPSKIDPEVFSIWMRVLAQIENSVLWLLDANPLMRQNLVQEASLCGINENRLIFAPRLPQEQHLERYRHADIFVDTFICNAHTTASDALWAGLPIVTRTGAQFAARVATSLLKAAGLPSLITTSSDAYEARILSLAQQPDERIGLREQLRLNRAHAPLFDTARYVQNYEAGLEEMHRRHHNGLGPKDIRPSKLCSLIEEKLTQASIPS